MKTKQEKSIAEILMAESKDLNNLILFTNRHVRENNYCNSICPSQETRIYYNLEYASGAGYIAGYIEFLQNKINELKK